MPASRRLSIFHVLAPARFGGLESVVRGLATGHARRGHGVRVAAITSGHGDEPHDLVASLQQAGVQAVEWRVGQRAYLEEARRVAGACRSWEPDVVHTHGYHADLVAGTSARRSGAPVVTTVHGFVGGGWKNRFYERLQRRAYRAFDAVVAVSRSLGRELAADGVPSEKIHQIPNAWGGHVEPVDRGEARSVLGLDGGEPVIGWVGRLGREKGLDVLLEALAGLRDRPWRLAVVGDGPEAARLRDLAEGLGMEGRVRWLGVVEDAGRYFRAFDVFCLSSRTEGTPVVLFEAMAAGVPVVATRVGGVGEILTEEAAWLCPPEDPGALGARLREALSSPEAAERRAATAGRVLAERFGPEAWLDRYEALYRRVSGSREEASRDGGDDAGGSER